MHGPEEVAFTNMLFDKVEEALEAAEQNDLKPFNKILEILKKPYDEQIGTEGYQSPSVSDEKYQTFCGT